MPKKRANLRARKKALNAKRRAMKPVVRGEAGAKLGSGTRAIASRPVVWPTENGRIPERCLMKLRYAENGLSLAPVAYFGQYGLKINSTYDPNLTGTGHQPDMRDMLASVYDKYRVNGCRIKWRIRNNTSALTTVGILATDSATGSMDSDQIKQRCHVYATLKGNGGEGDSLELVLPVNFKSIVGPKLTDSAYTANYTADPSDLIYGYLQACADDLTTNISLTHSVELLQYVESFEPNDDRALD